MTVIRAENVFKVFGRKPERGVEMLQGGADREQLRSEGLTAAVIDACFEVEQGEMFVVMGLSGSGKSTLIRMVNGLLDTTAGRMEVKGQDVRGMSPSELREMRRKNVSMVFQSFALLPHRTVGENAAYGLEIQGMAKVEREAKARKALDLVGLGEWAGSLPGQLSGGMRQRVGLARALAAGTDILLMDEAFSALDPLIRRDMQDQLVELQRELGKTILFISHDLNEAMRIGDRIAMMRDGRIVQIGTPSQIVNDPADDYVAKFTQDVERTKVLTAASIAEMPEHVLDVEEGLSAAQAKLADSALAWLLVLDPNGEPAGILWREDVARAVESGATSLPWSPEHRMPVVGAGTHLADLFAPSAEHRAPLVVVDADRHVVGVVTRANLLHAMGASPDSADLATTSSQKDDRA